MRLIIIIITLFIALPLSYAEDLCPNIAKIKPPSGADELKMHESQFNFNEAISSIKYLEKDVHDILGKHDSTKDVFFDSSFYISYPNSIKFVKGTLLKQRALIAKKEFEIAKLIFSNGSGNKDEVNLKEKTYKAVLKDFCEYLSKAEYVD